jgi:sialic acid synthase SpsE
VNLWSDKARIAEAKKGEIPIKWLAELSEYAHNLGLKFGCSVYSVGDVKKVTQYVDFFKIASFESNHVALINECAYTDKLVFISFGAAQQDLVEGMDMNGRYAFLLCVSDYPAKLSDYEAWRIPEDVSGISVHTNSYLPAMVAVSRGALFVESHLDLVDMKGNESKHGHCFLPENMKTMIDVARQCEEILGGKTYEEIDEARKKFLPLMWNPKTGKRGCTVKKS